MVLQTLEQLNNGELSGIKRLQLAENLTQFPTAIYDLADSLEILDLSNNALTSLPDDLARLSKLKILFCSNNRFTHLPESIGACPNLEMIGFKSNQIRTVSGASLPKITRWLILTDNQIEVLPDDIGSLPRLQKLALAGNKLQRIPDSIQQCQNLELIRLSANSLQRFPDVLLTLPKLAWLAFSGNPFCMDRDRHAEFKTIAASDLIMHEVLGQGASGVISKATWHNNPFSFPDSIAVKIFKGAVTSDGYPEDELDACLSIGTHDNIVSPLAKISEPDCSALLMELIPKNYVNLGQPPSLTSCTRDTFTQGQAFSIHQINLIVEQMEQVLQHFIEKEISHGDLYAHNILIDPAGHILFGDFGAASKYVNLSPQQKRGIQAVEQRAMGLFIDDMLGLCFESDKETALYKVLESKSLNH